jgi:hypothetical protein
MDLFYCELPKGFENHEIAGQKQLDSLSDEILGSEVGNSRCGKPCIKANGQVTRRAYV